MSGRTALQSRTVRLFALPLLLAGCERGVLDPAGPVAAGDRSIMVNSLTIMLAIIVPVIVLTLAFAWWFRAGNKRATYLPDWSYSGQLELLVWSIPLLAVIFLAGIAWVGSHRLDPAQPLAAKGALPVQVVALDWKWLFIYPEQGVATLNHLVIPAGRPVALRITSATVMNSFFVPRLGSQIYAMSGMDAGLNLQADHPGRFRGISAHYSGEGFADMTFATDAVPPAQFAAWATQAKRGPALDVAAYRKLALTEATARPATFGAVAPGLYQSVLADAGTTAQRPLAHSGRVN